MCSYVVKKELLNYINSVALRMGGSFKSLALNMSGVRPAPSPGRVCCARFSAALRQRETCLLQIHVVMQRCLTNSACQVTPSMHAPVVKCNRASRRRESEFSGLSPRLFPYFSFFHFFCKSQEKKPI